MMSPEQDTQPDSQQAVDTPAPDTPDTEADNEKLLPQDKVNEIVGQTRIEARERLQRDLADRLGADSWEQAEQIIEQLGRKAPPAQTATDGHAPDDITALAQTVQELRATVEQLRAERQAEQLARARADVMAAHDIPDEFSELITGDTAEAMTESAARIAAAIEAEAEKRRAKPKPKAPATHGSAGSQTLPPSQEPTEAEREFVRRNYPSQRN